METFLTETNHGLAVSTQNLWHPFLLSHGDGAGQTTVMLVCDWSLPAGASYATAAQAPHALSLESVISGLSTNARTCVVVSR